MQGCSYKETRNIKAICMFHTPHSCSLAPTSDPSIKCKDKQCNQCSYYEDIDGDDIWPNQSKMAEFS